MDAFSLSWVGPSTVPNVENLGYAFTLMSRLVFEVKEYKDALTWGGGYGEGQAHKIISLAWDGKASGVVDSVGLTNAPAWFAYAGYNHYWSKSFNSNIAVMFLG